MASKVLLRARLDVGNYTGHECDMKDTKEIIIESLNDISERLGKNVTHVEDVRRLSGGASQETWAFTAVSDTEKHKRILRRAPFQTNTTQGIGLAKEAEILDSLQHLSIPIPAVLHVFSNDSKMGSAYVMNAIEGETLPQKIIRDPKFSDARDQVAAQIGPALARLHSVSMDIIPDLPFSGPKTQLDQYEAVLRTHNVERPVLELALRWLRENSPANKDQALVHGDFRMGNLMIDGTGLAGILDWELCHIGDPREDIGWLCVNSWRFGRRDLRVGGVGHLEALLETYEKAGGRPITPREIDYWECLGSFKWGAMCTMMYETFRTGADPSIERGSIGRRVSETEIDLMNILEKF